MKKLIIHMTEGEAYNAASKARRDAEEIAFRCGYTPLTFKSGRTANGSLSEMVHIGISAFQNWQKVVETAEKGSIILVQYPHYPIKTAILMRRMIQKGHKRDLHFIALIHDLDSLRTLHGRGAVFSDQKVLPVFDAIICHNEKMKEYLTELGISKDKLISIGLFDYLFEGETAPFGDGVVIAGNLSADKCGYIQKLIRGIRMPIHLYGKGMEKGSYPTSVHNHGAFPPEELPAILEGGYGLVWDGTEINDCVGVSGEYLKWNNPHKFSLYMAACKPVIVWKESALAELVTKQKLGIVVSSLEDVENMLHGVSLQEIEEMLRNVGEISKQVRQGRYLQEAIRKAEIVAKQ